MGRWLSNSGPEQYMKSDTRRLYWRIAGLYLGLLLAFSIIATFLAAREFEGFLGEVEQRLNRELAWHLTRELATTIATPATDGAQGAVRRVTGINPSIDMYLLSADGRVTTSFTGKAAVRDRVDVVPIQQFLEKDARLPIRGIDPGDPKSEKVFSAAPLPASSGGGYLYIILPGMPFETMAHMVRTSYILRGSASLLAAVLLSTLLAGMVLFFIVTSRFQRLTDTVKKFQEGAFHERTDIEPTDPIGRLGVTFNDMAAAIERQFAALKQTDDARGVFAANISHDFRTPLTALRGYADRMLRAEDLFTPEERRAHLKIILQSATQLEHLADQLAMIVQLDGTGRYTFKVEPFSIADLAQDAVLKFTPEAQEHDVSLRLVDPENVPQVIGDIALLERAMANLIDNAINSTGPGGKIQISLPVIDAHVLFRVQDTGCGIDGPDLPLLTQRFFRTMRSRASQTSGSGLGLAIVDEILKKHGTVLKVESQVDVGSVFSFALPTA
jgi:two-component system OmpR family sensor kinase